MKTAIVGYGIVGKATHHCVLNNSTDVDIYDIDNISDFDKVVYDLVFVCIPTSSHSDLDALTTFVRKILDNTATSVCIRSSVPVGFISQGFADVADRVIYFPEFLRERRWKEDSEIAPWVVGSTSEARSLLDSFAHGKELLFMTVTEAEILKMMVNAYSALRVVFANHIYSISQQLDADYATIERHYNLVEHKDQNYLKVNDQLRGFGGKCLPKDLKFLIETFSKLGIEQTLLTSTQVDNEQWPTTVRQDT